jgi:hypothetical protein
VGDTFSQRYSIQSKFGVGDQCEVADSRRQAPRPQRPFRMSGLEGLVAFSFFPQLARDLRPLVFDNESVATAAIASR